MSKQRCELCCKHYSQDVLYTNVTKHRATNNHKKAQESNPDFIEVKNKGGRPPLKVKEQTQTDEPKVNHNGPSLRSDVSPEKKPQKIDDLRATFPDEVKFLIANGIHNKREYKDWVLLHHPDKEKGSEELCARVNAAVNKCGLSNIDDELDIEEYDREKSKDMYEKWADKIKRIFVMLPDDDPYKMETIKQREKNKIYDSLRREIHIIPFTREGNEYYPSHTVYYVFGLLGWEEIEKIPENLKDSDIVLVMSRFGIGDKAREMGQNCFSSGKPRYGPYADKLNHYHMIESKDIDFVVGKLKKYNMVYNMWPDWAEFGDFMGYDDEELNKKKPH